MLVHKIIRADVLALVKRRELSQHQQKPSNNVAMTSTGGPRDGNSRIKGDCWNCGKPGHRADDCPSASRGGGRQGGSRRGGHGRRGRKNGDNRDGGSATIALMSLTAGSNNVPRKGLRDFVMDNAAPCGHTSTQREHFKTLTLYPESERPTIGGIGSSRVQVHGRGDIHLKRDNDCPKERGLYSRSFSEHIRDQISAYTIGQGDGWRRTS